MILLAIGLAAFALAPIVPLTPAQAREALRVAAAGPEQAHSPSPSPVILVATGLLAFFPLLFDDPALLKKPGKSAGERGPLTFSPVALIISHCLPHRQAFC